MANMSAMVTGLDPVLANLLIAMAKLKEEADAVTLVSAQRIYNASQSDIAVDTTAAQTSGVIEPFSEGPVKGYAVSYGGGLPTTKKTYSYPDNTADSYPWFIELGTVNMPARPFLMPAFDTETPNWLASLDVL